MNTKTTHSHYRFTMNREIIMHKINNRFALKTLLIYIAGLFIIASSVHAKSNDGSDKPVETTLKQFVITLDSPSIDKLVSSHNATSESKDKSAAEIKYGVTLKEDFRSEESSYAIVESSAKSNIDDYLATLDVSPSSIIESEFTNSPELGGGPEAADTPKDGHKVYVIERAVPGISGLPQEKMVEVSQGSQKVVAQFGDSLEWDKSLLTKEGTFCVYRTDDPDHIIKHAKIAGFPADKVTAVEHTVHSYVF